MSLWYIVKCQEEEEQSGGDDSNECRFGAPKFILAARSPVFPFAMFNNEMQENEKSEQTLNQTFLKRCSDICTPVKSILLLWTICHLHFQVYSVQLENTS